MIKQKPETKLNLLNKEVSQTGILQTKKPFKKLLSRSPIRSKLVKKMVSEDDNTFRQRSLEFLEPSPFQRHKRTVDDENIIIVQDPRKKKNKPTVTANKGKNTKNETAQQVLDVLPQMPNVKTHLYPLTERTYLKEVFTTTAATSGLDKSDKRSSPKMKNLAGNNNNFVFKENSSEKRRSPQKLKAIITNTNSTTSTPLSNTSATASSSASSISSNVGLSRVVLLSKNLHSMIKGQQQSYPPKPPAIQTGSTTSSKDQQTLPSLGYQKSSFGVVQYPSTSSLTSGQQNSLNSGSQPPLQGGGRPISPRLKNLNITKRNSGTEVAKAYQVQNINHFQATLQNSTSQNSQQNAGLKENPGRMHYFTLENLLRNNQNLYFDHEIMQEKLLAIKQQKHFKLRKFLQKIPVFAVSVAVTPALVSPQIPVNYQKGLSSIEERKKSLESQENSQLEQIKVFSKENQSSTQTITTILQSDQTSSNGNKININTAIPYCYMTSGRFINFDKRFFMFQDKNSTIRGSDKQSEQPKQLEEIQDKEFNLPSLMKEHDKAQEDTRNHLTFSSSFTSLEDLEQQQLPNTNSIKSPDNLTNWEQQQQQAQQFEPNPQSCWQEDCSAPWQVEEQGEDGFPRDFDFSFQKEERIEEIHYESNQQFALEIIPEAMNEAAITATKIPYPEQGLSQTPNELTSTQGYNSKIILQPQQEIKETPKQHSGACFQNSNNNINNAKTPSFSFRSFPQFHETVQLKRVYSSSSHRGNGTTTSQTRQYFAIFHFDGVLGRFDRPFFTKADFYNYLNLNNNYSEEDTDILYQHYHQSPYSQSSQTKEMSIHELMLKFFWQRENIKSMFKAISQFYSIVVILPESNNVWEYLFNFFMHNKYPIDAIYQSQTPNNPSKNQSSRLFMDYSTILKDFCVQQPKKVLLFNSLDVQSEEQFFTIRREVQLAQQSNHETNQQSLEQQLEGGGQQKKQENLIVEPIEMVLDEREICREEENKDDTEKEKIEEDKEDTPFQQRCLKAANEKNYLEGINVNTNNSNNNADVILTLLPSKAYPTNSSAGLILKNLIIENPDYISLFIGKFAKINMQKENLHLILLPSMYMKERSSTSVPSYSSALNCKTITEICFEFISEGSMRIYLQRNRTQWGLVEIPLKALESHRDRLIYEEHQLLKKTALKISQEKATIAKAQQIQKEPKWEEDSMAQRLEIYFRQRIGQNIHLQQGNNQPSCSRRFEDTVNTEELSLNIKDVCMRNSKILKQINASNKLKRHVSSIQSANEDNGKIGGVDKKQVECKSEFIDENIQGFRRNPSNQDRNTKGGEETGTKGDLHELDVALH